MQRAQTDGDVTNGLVLAGQVASAIGDIISVAEFVPQMAEEAAAVLRSLCASLPVPASPAPASPAPASQERAAH